MVNMGSTIKHLPFLPINGCKSTSSIFCRRFYPNPGHPSHIISHFMDPPISWSRDKAGGSNHDGRKNIYKSLLKQKTSLGQWGISYPSTLSIDHEKKPWVCTEVHERCLYSLKKKRYIQKASKCFFNSHLPQIPLAKIDSSPPCKGPLTRCLPCPISSSIAGLVPQLNRCCAQGLARYQTKKVVGSRDRRNGQEAVDTWIILDIISGIPQKHAYTDNCVINGDANCIKNLLPTSRTTLRKVVPNRSPGYMEILRYISTDTLKLQFCQKHPKNTTCSSWTLRPSW